MLQHLPGKAWNSLGKEAHAVRFGVALLRLLFVQQVLPPPRQAGRCRSAESFIPLLCSSVLHTAAVHMEHAERHTSTNLLVHQKRERQEASVLHVDNNTHIMCRLVSSIAQPREGRRKWTRSAGVIRPNADQTH